MESQIILGHQCYSWKARKSWAISNQTREWSLNASDAKMNEDGSPKYSRLSAALLLHAPKLETRQSWANK